MKKKDTADSGAQYAGTQPIQHAEVVLGQSPEPTKPAQKPKASVLPSGVLSSTHPPFKTENARIRKTRSKPIL